tara:strand:+ start:551 stop:970 length:420 start_codon:yes stop_codon:yes gene_type:complete
MITLIHLNSRLMTDGLTGWDTEQGKVYADLTTFPKGDAEVEAALDFQPKAFKLVAKIDFNGEQEQALEQAFMHTQHVNEHWFDALGDEVLETFVDKSVTRSTSVGDVMVKDGKGYLVAPVGFVELSPETTARVLASIEG